MPSQPLAQMALAGGLRSSQQAPGALLPRPPRRLPDRLPRCLGSPARRAVGGTVSVEVERGGVPLSADIGVQDLHDVTPSRLLDVGGGAVNELSYQQARNNRAAVGQVYVAEPGGWVGRPLALRRGSMARLVCVSGGAP